LGTSPKPAETSTL